MADRAQPVTVRDVPAGHGRGQRPNEETTQRVNPRGPRGSTLDALTKTGTPFEADPYAAAVPRLAVLAMLLAFLSVVFGIGTTLIHFEVLSFPWTQDTFINYATVSAAFVVAVIMIAITRARTLAPERILAWGLVFQVFGGLAIGFAEQQSARPGVSVSFVCIWILSFTLLPVSPQRAALAAYATALTGPLALMIYIATGHRPPPTGPLEWLTFAPNIVAAMVSILISKVIYGLGRQVENARKLGAYELIEELGHGGMGEVWRAEHQSLIRPAAVKLLRRELTSHLTAAERESVHLRFQREVQATAMLSSPHTVAVFDFGHTNDGSLYYVMELLNGLDAETLIEKYGPQPSERVIYFLRQACESLAEAHRRNLIHRDVKPANIYLCAIGLKVDFLKILDFGLVRDLSSNLRITNEGAVSGTPAYLAPEASTHNTFDARGDIYALGCVAYYMLTGELVFHGETAAAVMAAHIRDKPVPPSRRTELPIPPELEAIVMDCLAKDPNDRPQTAEELQRRLVEVPLATPWNQDRAQAWWSTHVPHLVQRACANCGKDDPDAAPAVRRRPNPVLRESIGI
jgi:serine/threonine protein kinase